MHYDPLVLESSDEEILQRVFPIDDDVVLIQAQQIARDAFEARSFTNTTALQGFIQGKGGNPP